MFSLMSTGLIVDGFVRFALSKKKEARSTKPFIFSSNYKCSLKYARVLSVRADNSLLMDFISAIEMMMTIHYH